MLKKVQSERNEMAILRRKEKVKPILRTRSVRDMRLDPIKRIVDVYSHYGTIVVHIKNQPGIRNLRQCLVFEEHECYYAGLDISEPEYIRVKFDELANSQVMTLFRLLGGGNVRNK